MPTKCISLVKGRRIRVTKLDSCGRPVFGECSQAVSKGFISVAFTANTIDTDEINVTNAAGERCVFEPAETSLSGYTLEIAFCEVDPDLFALVTGQPVVSNVDEETIGFDIDTATNLSAQGFALELWAGAANSDACATEGAQGSYGYLLIPFLKGGIVGDFTVENGAVTFTISGATTRDGNAWGVGPYPDIMLDGALPTPAAGPMQTAVSPTTALRTMIVDLNPPEVACGCRPLLDPDGGELIGISAVVAGMLATFTPDPDDLITPFWYDFGDGTWDYIASGSMGATTHTYASAGTYTARASTNGTWVETTVVIA